MRRFLDKDAVVRGALSEIAEVSEAMAAAVAAQDVGGLADALNREWGLRQQLSPVVTNDAIDALVKEARDAGALAAKICGAGGGGCLVLVVEDASAPWSVGHRVDFAPDPVGLTVA